MKIYLSRATTRAMMADYPIGDPTGGPAYGEKRDPISAAISIFSMAGTYAAAGSFAAMTIFQGITFAGAALSLKIGMSGPWWPRGLRCTSLSLRAGGPRGACEARYDLSSDLCLRNTGS